MDFSKSVPEETCQQIADAAHTYGVLVFKQTRLDDDRHITFAEKFGELDSVLQFIPPGTKTRLRDDWDAGNLDVNGNIMSADSRHYRYDKVLLGLIASFT